jgi:hypothetical protein
MRIHTAYLLRETAVSVVINAALSLLVAWLVFGRSGAASVDDAQAFAVDFLPQALILSLMSSLVPGALTRHRVRQGQIAPLAPLARPVPRNLLWRSVLLGVVAMLVAGGAALLLSLALWTGPLPLQTVYAIKTVFGVLLAVPVTLLAVRAALADGA